MVRYEQFEAWLQFEDTVYVSEYSTQVNGNEVSCIVGSNTKLPFSVHWKDNGSKLFTAGYIVVDGVKASGRFLHGTGQTYRSGFRKGPTSEEPFTFTRESGKIQLIITLVENGDVRIHNDARFGIAMRDQMYASQGLAYRSLPGHETITVPQQHEATYGVSSVGGQPGKTIVTFTFNYRSKEWMEANGIGKLRPNTPPLPITVWNSREHPSQHGGDWPASRAPEPEPKRVFSTEARANRAGEYRDKYKAQLDTAMVEKYGFPTYDYDGPDYVVPENLRDNDKALPKSRKGKEPAIPRKTRVPQGDSAAARGAGVQSAQPQPQPLPRPQPQPQSQPQLQNGADNAKRQAEKPARVPFDGVKKIDEVLEVWGDQLRADMEKTYGPDWDKPEPPRTYRKRKPVNDVRSIPPQRKEKAPAEAETLWRATSQSTLVARPTDMQQHPRGSNTYVLPSPAPTSSSSSSTPRPPFDAGRPSPHSMQPPPIPYLTSSGRPSAVIDTRFFGYASPAASEASTSSGHRSGQPAQR